MKNIKLIVLVTAISILAQNAYSATIQLAAPADVKTTFATVNDGDVIELTTSGGAYTWSSKVTVSTDKSITIRAAAGLEVRPVILWSGTTPAATNYFVQYSPAGNATKTLTFDGIEFDGATKVGALFLGKCTGTSNLIVSINNCVVRNILAGSQVCLYSAIVGSTIYGDLTVRNTEFRNFGTTVISPNGTTASPNNVSFINCLFVGPTTGILTTAAVKMAVSNYNSITLDHCTFNGLNIAEFSTKSSLGVSSIKNTIFANSTNATNTQPNQFGSTPNFLNLGADCGIYYTAAGTLGTIYPSLRTTAVTKWTDPALDSDGFATAAPYLTGSTDGKPIGYYSLNASVPTIKTDMVSMPDFNHVSGASEVVPIKVSGSYLISDITISAPSGYELSLNGATGFSPASLVLPQTSGSVSPVSVYVRLANGLARGSYSGNISLTSSEATTKLVAVTGQVTPTPVISISDLIGFGYILGFGASIEQDISVCGTGLTGDILITSPTNYEISLQSGTGFVGINSISLAQTNGEVPLTKIYIRLKLGLLEAIYSENLLLNSAGTTEQKILLTGVVGNFEVDPLRIKKVKQVQPINLKIIGNNTAKKVHVYKVIVQ